MYYGHGPKLINHEYDNNVYTSSKILKDKSYGLNHAFGDMTISKLPFKSDYSKSSDHYQHSLQQNYYNNRNNNPIISGDNLQTMGKHLCNVNTSNLNSLYANNFSQKSTNGFIPSQANTSSLPAKKRKKFSKYKLQDSFRFNTPKNGDSVRMTTNQVMNGDLKYYNKNRQNNTLPKSVQHTSFIDNEYSSINLQTSDRKIKKAFKKDINSCGNFLNKNDAFNNDKQTYSPTSPNMNIKPNSPHLPHVASASSAKYTTSTSNIPCTPLSNVSTKFFETFMCCVGFKRFGNTAMPTNSASFRGPKNYFVNDPNATSVQRSKSQNGSIRKKSSYIPVPPIRKYSPHNTSIHKSPIQNTFPQAKSSAPNSHNISSAKPFKYVTSWNSNGSPIEGVSPGHNFTAGTYRLKKDSFVGNNPNHGHNYHHHTHNGSHRNIHSHHHVTHGSPAHQTQNERADIARDGIHSHEVSPGHQEKMINNSSGFAETTGTLSKSYQIPATIKVSTSPPSTERLINGNAAYPYHEEKSSPSDHHSTVDEPMLPVVTDPNVARLGVQDMDVEHKKNDLIYSASPSNQNHHYYPGKRENLTNANSFNGSNNANNNDRSIIFSAPVPGSNHLENGESQGREQKITAFGANNNGYPQMNNGHTNGTYELSPPPKLLSDPSFLDVDKICVVIDLDETLVHSSFKPVDNANYIIPVNIDDTLHQVYVLKRPHVDEFLQRVSRIFECILFTASLSKYADPVADLLDKEGRYFKARLFREACVFYQGNYVKDLNRLGRDTEKVVIIDNSPASYIFNPENAIPISSWFGDPNDRELLDLIPLLHEVARAPDAVKALAELTRHKQRLSPSNHHHHVDDKITSDH